MQSFVLNNKLEVSGPASAPARGHPRSTILVVHDTLKSHDLLAYFITLEDKGHHYYCKYCDSARARPSAATAVLYTRLT